MFHCTRPAAFGRRYAVATAHPWATRAGMAMLAAGGNAVDAVVAAAAALGVVEPYMSGPAGVGWLLFHRHDGTAHVLNFSGCAPRRATPDQFTSATQTDGPRAPVVPGNVAGWFEMHRRFGSLPAGRLFAPAIEAALEGFPLQRFNVEMIPRSLERVDEVGRAIYDAVPLRIGAVLRQPELGRTLQRIAEGGPDEFYRGETARKIAGHLQSVGGLIDAHDLAAYSPTWEAPIECVYRGRIVRTCAPNNEGFQILQTLRLLEPFDLAQLGHNTADSIHLLSEAVKLAVADRIVWAGDPAFHPVPVAELLDEGYLAERRRLIRFERASVSEGERWRPDRPAGAVEAGLRPALRRAGASSGSGAPGTRGGVASTTHLSAVDVAGNVASITQSLGHGFGSGTFIPGTGLAMNSFCHWYEIDPRCPTPNVMAPGKRWASCMAPLHVLNGAAGEPAFWFSLSTPGSWGILHTTVQMLSNVIDHGADLQGAIDAARFRLWEGTRMQIETRVPEAVRTALSARGHQLEPIGDYSYLVGGAQGVMIDPASGYRVAAADPRRDGVADAA